MKSPVLDNKFTKRKNSLVKFLIIPNINENTILFIIIY